MCTATAKLTQTIERETYLLELMTSSSQELTGEIFVDSPRGEFPRVTNVFSLTCCRLDADAEDARVNARVETLVRISRDAGSDFWANEDRCRTIIQFQDRATQARDFINFCQSSLTMVYNARFPWNKQPESFEELKKLFKRTENIHHFMRAQLVAGAKLALAWVRYHHKKIDFT